MKFAVGDKVRVGDPNSLIRSVESKVRGRMGVVQKVFKPLAQFYAPRYRVKFLRNGNRGKDCELVLREQFLEAA